MISFTAADGTTITECSGGGVLGLVSTVQSTERMPRNFPSNVPVISTKRSFSSKPSAAAFTSMWAPLSRVSSLMVAPCLPTSQPPTSCVTKKRATDWDFWDGLMCSGMRSPQGRLSSPTAPIPAVPLPPPGSLKLAAVRLPRFTVSCKTAWTRDTASWIWSGLPSMRRARSCIPLMISFIRLSSAPLCSRISLMVAPCLPTISPAALSGTSITKHDDSSSATSCNSRSLFTTASTAASFASTSPVIVKILSLSVTGVALSRDTSILAPDSSQIWRIVVPPLPTMYPTDSDGKRQR
mmetsp:Transcript_19385/g.46691  ORF Transcript_19385/g.46691 Transcript_19385/m.46691 type:complete len:295 (-) Transcript_19385:67-951(-)